MQKARAETPSPSLRFIGLNLIKIFADQIFVNAGIDISISFLFTEIPDCLLGTPMIATETRDANIAECDFPILHRDILRRAYPDTFPAPDTIFRDRKPFPDQMPICLVLVINLFFRLSLFRKCRFAASDFCNDLINTLIGTAKYAL